MDTEDARKGRVVSQAGESSSRASLQLELRVPDTQMLTIFRDAFLRWLTHRTGPFGRAIGFGDRLSVDEVAPTSDVHGMSTLRLTVSWSPSKSATLARVNSLRTLGGFRTALPHQTSPESFVFVQYPPLADAPLHPELPDDEAGEPVLEPYPRLSRRRRGSRIGTNAARGFAAAMTDVQGWARESLRGAGRRPADASRSDARDASARLDARPPRERGGRHRLRRRLHVSAKPEPPERGCSATGKPGRSHAGRSCVTGGRRNGSGSSGGCG